MAVIEVTVPDIGDFADVEVIDVLVSAGDSVAAEDPLITLETDKASMDVPAPSAGTIKELKVGVGDKVSQGSLILLLESADSDTSTTSTSDSNTAASTGATSTSEPETTTAAAPEPVATPQAPAPAPAPAPALASEQRRPPPPPATAATDFSKVHASPSVRRFARELGVDLRNLQDRGSGRKQRITREDVQQFVKQALSAPATSQSGGGGAIPPIPSIDFSQFGEIDEQPLTRIERLSGPHLHRAWLNIPMVTQFDDSDITELEEFRKSLKAEAEKRGVRITALAFIMRALAASLREFPKFNASLSADGQSLIYKKYCHLGIAVDTPNGLVVPVFRDVDQKSLFELSAELGEVSARARDGKLKASDLQGGCMSISSLGGIGGTSFTPIVNAPEVAILGVARGQIKPVWDGQTFQPRLMLPLALTYDHRVIDGALGARFIVHLSQLLADVRRLLL